MLRYSEISLKVAEWWRYCSRDVWYDTRRTFRVNLVKTINLSVKSFFNTDLQSQACAMTFRTLLAVVPALALLFAIGRGFGLQNLLEDELLSLFPSQRQAVEYALNFVDSYLSQSSEGLFVGIGLVFLLWTLISLMGNIEDTFNKIWGVGRGRSFGRKIIDYTAMLLILPVVMVCAGGINIMLSNTLRSLLDFEFLTPVVSIILELFSMVLTWMFFTLVYILIPNTKVKFVHALVSGVFAGSGFLILQWVFVSGQMYVARYNAIYGTFSFLPLMLIWLQLTYVIVFAGAVICYSSQNIFVHNFSDAIQNMSSSYYARLVIAVGALIVQRFIKDCGATTVPYMSREYNMPPKLVTRICDKMVDVGILSLTEIDPKKEIKGYQPAFDPTNLTVGGMFDRLDRSGSADFIPGFKDNFPGVVSSYGIIKRKEAEITDRMLLSEIEINLK